MVWVSPDGYLVMERPRTQIPNTGYLSTRSLVLEDWRTPGELLDLSLCWNPKEVGSNTAKEHLINKIHDLTRE